MKITLSHLATANLFTSKDATRAVLNSVAVADGLVIGCDTYRLAVIGAAGLRPAELIEATKAIPTEDLTLIPSSVCATIATAAKANKPKILKEYAFEYSVDDNVWSAKADWFVSSGLLNQEQGSYPNVANLFTQGQPAAVTGVGFNATYLADYAKAIKLLTGSAPSSHTPIVFHGGESVLKPVYFSANVDTASMLVLQMPVKLTDATRNWSHDAPVQAAA